MPNLNPNTPPFIPTFTPTFTHPSPFIPAVSPYHTNFPINSDPWTTYFGPRPTQSHQIPTSTVPTSSVPTSRSIPGPPGIQGLPGARGPRGPPGVSQEAMQLILQRISNLESQVAQMTSQMNSISVALACLPVEEDETTNPGVIGSTYRESRYSFARNSENSENSTN